MEASSSAAAETQPLLGNSIVSATEQHGSQAPTSDRNLNLVDFDKPSDPENPLDWPPSFKWFIVVLLALINFTITFACVSVVPVASFIARDLNSGHASKSASVLLVTIWELGEAAGPLFVAPLSERVGRRPVLVAANGFFICTIILSGIARSPGQFVAARFLSGLSVASNVLNPAIVGDMFAPDQRGSAMSALMVSPLIGSAFGPWISGAVAETLGWRSIMWASAALMGLCQILFLASFRETYMVVILRRKAARLRSETGNGALKTVFDLKVGEQGYETMWEAAMRPIKVFRASGVLMMMSLFGSVIFSFFYVLSVTLADIMQDLYGFTPAQAGSTFLAFSAGAFVATFVCHALLDPIYIRLRTTRKGIGRPEFRLPLLIVGAVLTPVVLAFYAWSAQLRLPVPVMVASVAAYGFSPLIVSIPLMSYVVDSFGVYSASAVTSLIVSRCIMATFLPMTTTPLISALGYGWGLSVLAALPLLLIPIPLLVWRYGHRWRQLSDYTKER